MNIPPTIDLSGVETLEGKVTQAYSVNSPHFTSSLHLMITGFDDYILVGTNTRVDVGENVRLKYLPKNSAHGFELLSLEILNSEGESIFTYISHHAYSPFYKK